MRRRIATSKCVPGASEPDRARTGARDSRLAAERPLVAPLDYLAMQQALADAVDRA
jgi:hypothetical protein